MNGALVALVAVALLTCGADASGDGDDEGPGVSVRVEIPERVAEQAAALAAGDAAASPPVLILEDVEIEAGEGLTIEVRAPAAPGTKGPGPVLGTAAMVGSAQPDRSAPPERFTLVVPLADEAAQLLAGRREVTFTLTVKDAPERQPLVLAGAHFDEGAPD